MRMRFGGMLLAVFWAGTATGTPTIINYQSLSMNTTVDMLPDFSFAGYNLSNSPLPDANRPATVIISPSASPKDDKTAEIQKAIDAAAKKGGGIVELARGTFYLSSDPINLFGSNVTLRGQLPSGGETTYPTTIIVSGQPRFVFTIGKPAYNGPSRQSNTTTAIVEPYVPVGRNFVTVANAQLFKVGQMIIVEKTLTQDWVSSLGMDLLVRDGRKQTWIRDSTVMPQYRTIVAIVESTLTFDIPLTDSIDARFQAKGQVTAYTLPKGQTTGIGIENLSIAPTTFQSGLPITSRDAFEGVAVFSPFVQDCWARAINITGFLSSINVQKGARQITLSDVQMVRTAPANNLAGYPADIMLQGSTTLVLRCATIGVSGSTAFSVATGSLVAGPNAVVQFTAKKAVHQIQPHQRWATGFLLDNSDIGSAYFINRGIMGSGQGWSIGNGVLWNVRSVGVIRVQSPPFSANLCVGCIEGVPSDTAKFTATPLSYISRNESIAPASLFATQLIVRRGTSALDEILMPPIALPVVKLEDINLRFNAVVKAKKYKNFSFLSVRKCKRRSTLTPLRRQRKRSLSIPSTWFIQVFTWVLT